MFGGKLHEVCYPALLRWALYEIREESVRRLAVALQYLFNDDYTRVFVAEEQRGEVQSRHERIQSQGAGTNSFCPLSLIEV